MKQVMWLMSKHLGEDYVLTGSHLILSLYAWTVTLETHAAVLKEIHSTTRTRVSEFKATIP